ncbi:MAG: STAS domain-containing protein [Lautropia sp.]
MTDAAEPGPAGDAQVALHGEYTIHTVGERASALALEIARGASRFDLSAVTDFDSAGLQVLLAAKATLAERGQALELAAIAPAVRAVLASYALDAGLSPGGGGA